MKKLLTLFLALVASVGIHAAIVNGTCGDNLTWSLNTKDSTLTIEGSGAMTEWSPWNRAPWSEYKSYIAHLSLPEGLTTIEYNSFANCSKLTTVTLPSSITTIEGDAFQECTALNTINIPDGVTLIGSEAFANCYDLKAINIPNSVTAIGGYTFENCKGLTSVTIGNGVVNLQGRVFYNCSNLASVIVGDNVKTIEWQAFNGCHSLTTVVLGNSIDSIGSGVFGGCNVTSLTVQAVKPPKAASCGINAGSCTLYVPQESIETYANAVWWEDFQNIRPIGSSLMVKFVDWDGKTLSFSYVESGEDAVAPADPTREGYTFIGWDKDFTNVTKDLVVTALYEEIVVPTYTIIYKDKEDALLDSEELTLHLPDAPVIDGFTFVGWDVVAGHLTDGIILRATYTADEPTSAPAVYTNPANPAQKLIRNGSVYILTEDKTYTITGQAVK